MCHTAVSMSEAVWVQVTRCSVQWEKKQSTEQVLQFVERELRVWNLCREKERQRGVVVSVWKEKAVGMEGAICTAHPAVRLQYLLV